MRCAERRLALALCGTLGAAILPAASPALHEQQRYVMGTMFRVLVYAADASAAERAAAAALAEVVRLDGVMSHYRADSELSRVNREAFFRSVAVDPTLYEVIEQSLAYSRLSDGRFDVTIGRLLRTWREANRAGRVPADVELEEAARCVGYQHVVIERPDRIRFRADCVEIDLGGIGKGYAVERALRVIRAHGIRHALVNAGGSTIAGIGAPPGREGWPVRIGASVAGSRTLLLRNASLSTSHQALVPRVAGGPPFGEILNPATRAPVPDTASVSVLTESATASDALSTTLLLMSVEDGKALLEHFPADVSALWISPAGELRAAHRAAALRLAQGS